MFFCLPIFFGCQTKIQPEGGQPSRICPRCHNASVFVAKSSTWFELFWIPVVPLSSKQIWLCGICQWKAPYVQGVDGPAAAQTMAPGGGYHGAPTHQTIYVQPASK